MYCISARWRLVARSGCAPNAAVIRKWAGTTGCDGADVGFVVSAAPCLLLKNYQGTPRALFKIIQIFMYTKKGDAKKDKQDQVPVGLIIEDLSSQQLPKRVNAVKRLKQITVALGYERTTNELLNMILHELINDQDEVVSVLIDRLLDISEGLGNPNHNLALLPIFEALIQIDSTNLRDKANDKLQQAISAVDIKKQQDPLVKFVRRIDAMEFAETRQALCRVICQILGAVSAPNQTELLNLYLKAANDQSMVSRMYAAKYSKDLVQYVKLNENIILKIVDALFKDKEQSNKIFLIDTLIQLAKHKQQAALQPYLNLISYQFTWRIRYELISRVRSLAEVLDKQLFRTLFLPFYTKYLNDLEAQIRSIACTQLKTVCEFLEVDDIVTKILPALKSLPQDSQVYVRHALAKSLLTICPFVGKKYTSEQILPKFLQLLKDQDSQVRLEMFHSVGQITKILGIQTLSQTTIPALQQLSTNKSWRIRGESVDILLYFAQGMGPDFLLNEKNNKMYFDLLKDKVFSVRKKAIESLKNLIQIHGPAWFEKNFLPKLIAFQKLNSYLQRETFIFAAQTVASLVTFDCLQKTITPLLLSMTSDSVENIRYNSLKALSTVARLLKDVQGIRRIVKSLKEDKDPDVKAMALKVQRQLQSR